MAILKQRLSRKNAAGGYDPVHLETSSDLVLRPDGTTVEAGLSALRSDLDEYDPVVDELSSSKVIRPDGTTIESFAEDAGAEISNAKESAASALEAVTTATNELNDIKEKITDTPRYQNLVIYSSANHGNVMDGGYNGSAGSDLGKSFIAGYDNRIGYPGAYVFGSSNILSGNAFAYGSGNRVFPYGYEYNVVIGTHNFAGTDKSFICGENNMVVSGTCVFRVTPELLGGTPQGTSFVKGGLFALNIVDLGDELNISGYMASVMSAIENAYNADKLFIIADSGSYPAIASYVKKSWMTIDKANNRILVQYPEDRSTTNTWRPQGGIAVTSVGKLEGVVTFGEHNLVTAYDAMAVGYGLIANWDHQVVLGELNVPGERRSMGSGNPPRLIIGKGTDDHTSSAGNDPNPFPAGDGVARANCFRVTDVGVYASGNYNATGADYAEMFEWLDANPNAEDRVGKFVTLDGDKLRLATSSDEFVLGVVSGNPSIVGDVHDDQWQGMYMYDIFGRPIFETVEIPERIEEIADDPNDPESITHTVTHPAREIIRQKLNPEYDSKKKYQPRSYRPEWASVGLMGKLVVIDDGTADVNSYVAITDESIATHSDIKTKFRVMKRLDDTHIQILIIP